MSVRMPPVFSCDQNHAGRLAGELRCGEVKLLRLADGETARVSIEPARGFDVGDGPGKSVDREVRGGTVGLILDARGRPLTLPDDRIACRAAMDFVVRSLRVYA